MKAKQWSILGFLVGLAMGCATASVVAQDQAPTPSASQQTSGPRGGVIHAQQAQARYAPGGKAVAWRYVTGQAAYVGRLDVAPGAGVPEHRDPTEEYIYVMEGRGTIWVDGQAQEVSPGALVYMPARSLVKFQNGDQTLKAVQVFAGPGPEAKYDAWSPQAP